MSPENPQAPDPMVGKTIGGRYRIVRRLGEGGMGAVYVGEQQLGTNVRKVAVKTLHPHLSHDPKILARFEREVGTISELQHPNTIQVFDFGKTDEGTLFIVMEFVEGRSVADILEKDGPMEPARVERILTQVCGSLAEAHGRGIVHRDLKPDNIVLCEKAGQKDWVEVLDFGIAKRSNEEDKEESKLTQQGMVLGTPPYMSPEQFTGKPVDARSDIYALGVMAYEMLSGRLPFAGNTAWEWATAHMTAPPLSIDLTPAGPNIPAPMKAAIARALEKLPEQRFATVNDFLAAFAGKGVDLGAFAPREPTAAMGRAKTEVGTPIQLPPGAFGGGPPAPMGGPSSHGTPAAGNHAMPVAAVPAGPTRSQGGSGGGSKTPLLIAAGVIGLLSVGAIVFAMSGKSSSSNGATGLDLGLDAAAPPTNLAATTPTGSAPVASASASAGHDEPVAPLAPLTPSSNAGGGGGGTVKPAGGGTTGAKPSGTTGSAGGSTGSAGGTTGGAGGTTGGSATPGGGAGAAEPKACQMARVMYSVGKKAEGDKFAATCKQQGGKP